LFPYLPLPNLTFPLFGPSGIISPMANMGTNYHLIKKSLIITKNNFISEKAQENLRFFLFLSLSPLFATRAHL